jgi:TolB-like protein/Flp pilus assembly protein TadD
MPNDMTAPDRPVTVFLSYAREDDARARRLAAALDHCGFTVWWDGLIEGGAAFAKSIADALEAADAVIVLWSANSIASDWVRDEAASGRERHRLVPLSLDGSKPPLGFRQYQVIKLARWRGRKNAPEIEAICRAVRAVVSGQSDAGPAPRAPVTRRGLLVRGTAAAALAAAGGTAWFANERGLFGGGADPLSIAVLPFRNLSGDKAQDYFSDGLTEEVRTALTRISALRVLAATSSETADEHKGDPKTIAADLGVGYLLTGSVQRAADTVRIAIELADGRTGFTRWSQSVDRKLNDIFAVQSDIARMVAEAMSVQVATTEPAPGGTHNVRAYEHYLQGRSLYNLAKDEASDRAALEHFELALAADPNFALAHAARSRSLASIAAQYAKSDQLKAIYTEAIASARRAVELAPNLAEGHLALAYALYTGRLDVNGARPSYERAYELGRGNADIGLLYAVYCARAGRPRQAWEAIEHAVTLDPLNPRAHRAAGTVAYATRRYADVLAPARRALELNPKITGAHGLIGSSLMQMGKLQDAKKEFEVEPTQFTHLSGLAIVNWRLGNKAEAQRWFDKLVTDLGDSAVYQQAEVLAQWGRTDEAIARLERARVVGDSGLIYMVTDPLLDPIRRQPKFALLLKQMNVG